MDEPITQWINQLRQSEPEAAQQLWDYYCERLYALARTKLSASARRVYDEEDAAISAFHSLCRGIAAQRYPGLNDRNNLWRLLVTITARKVTARHRHEGRDKRDSARVLTESALMKSDDESLGLDGFAGREPTPEFVAEVAETCDLLFAALDDNILRRITELKLEGFSNGEIAKQLGCTRRTVERKLERIRRLWNGVVPESPDADRDR
ncbi:MAG: HTH domain-containing protein [Planctomycetaceae bacterium]|nr:HTH domain-containing protein [Planctomycetaceae bacterium]